LERVREVGCNIISENMSGREGMEENKRENTEGI